MADKNIVIIGAGYAGVHAAKKLAKKYKKDSSVSITLIDRHSYHTMMTELHEVAAHRVEPDAIQFDLRRLFNRTKVNLVTDNVTHVDHNKKIVTTEHGEFDYDYLILGMGGEPNDFGTPGVGEHAFTLWSWEDAVKLREHIEKTVRSAAQIHDEAKRRAMLTFTVCGSGFTGIEMVGELLEWKNRLAKDNKLDAEDITLYVVEAAPTILNMLNRKDADKAERYMVKKGIKILKNSPIVEVKAGSIILKSGEEIPTHTLIWTAGVKANSDTKDYGMSAGRAGRLKVNEYMESEDHKDVYVIGDLAYYEEEPGKPTPQIVEAAEQTGMTAAKSIIAEISGGDKEAYKGKYHGVMVSIGARYGVADLSGIHLSGWFAILMKHMVNLYYFFGIRSGYYMFQYVMHEFFHTKDKRNIFRNFTTRYGNILWSLPLRIFVGGFWLVEAGTKIWGKSTWDEATSSWSNIPKLFNGLGEDSWLVGSTVRMPFEWLQTTTSGASEAAEATEWATPVLSKMPGIFQWFMEIVLPTPEMAVFMQKVMVFVELGIGLAILGGLFTWLASAASAGFLVMFTLSAMLGWDKLWALPASIALMNGSGRSVGLDYWVVPFLQQKVGDWWYGKERSIYQDGTSSKQAAKRRKAS
ncbi:FAD-dependent oxidoreductase [Aquibacillus koreensis]|uniref:NADH:ubiquinone reductase (non-electrogenic) n=1 Tax=Aquibacillus koreensis TaxID=279446 RepID=A0A9X3WQE6_9BACI|nr:FAD-dependent oxidoreductase [Aquibacillus koreensis]MCT2534299.1 FAD-dependent oxidoreductase [Aquibacillus koreensis]MDC3422376.1 FAD-dependent oxidoreductase [Aquibacillus koreensis]